MKSIFNGVLIGLGYAIASESARAARLEDARTLALEAEQRAAGITPREKSFLGPFIFLVVGLVCLGVTLHSMFFTPYKPDLSELSPEQRVYVNQVQSMLDKHLITQEQAQTQARAYGVYLVPNETPSQ